MKQSERSDKRRGAILGLDVGQSRTGVAVSTSGLATQPVGLLKGSLAAQAQQLVTVVSTFKVIEVVLGRGELGEQLMAGFNKIRPAIDQPLRWSVVDEAYTTKEAERLIRETRVPHQSDILAAELILEQYLAAPQLSEQGSDRRSRHDVD